MAANDHFGHEGKLEHGKEELLSHLIIRVNEW